MTAGNLFDHPFGNHRRRRCLDPVFAAAMVAQLEAATQP